MKKIIGIFWLSFMSFGVWADINPKVVYLKSISRCFLCDKPLEPADYLGLPPNIFICLMCREKERPLNSGSASESFYSINSSSSPCSSLSLESVYSGDGSVFPDSYKEDPLCRDLVDQAEYVDQAFQEFGAAAQQKGRKKKKNRKKKHDVSVRYKGHLETRNAMAPLSLSQQTERLYGASSETSPLFSPIASLVEQNQDPNEMNFLVSLRNGRHILTIKKGDTVKEVTIQALWGAGPLSVAVTSDGYYLRDGDTNKTSHFTFDQETELDEFLKKNGHSFEFKAEVFPYGLVPSVAALALKQASNEDESDLKEEKITWRYQVSSTVDGRYALEVQNSQGETVRKVLDVPIDEVVYNSCAQLVAVTKRGYYYYDFNTNQEMYFLPYQQKELDVFLTEKNIVLDHTIRNGKWSDENVHTRLSYATSIDDTLLQVQDERGNTIECQIGSKILRVLTHGFKVLVETVNGGSYLYDVSRIGIDNVASRHEFPADLNGFELVHRLTKNFVPCEPRKGYFGDSLANYFPPLTVNKFRQGEMIVRTEEHPLSEVLDTLKAGRDQFADSVAASDDEYTYLYDEVGKALYIVGPGGQLIKKEVVSAPVYKRGAQLLLPYTKGDIGFFDLKKRFTEIFFVKASERPLINLTENDVSGAPVKGFKAELLQEGFREVLPEEGKTSVAIQQAANELAAARMNARVTALAEQLAHTKLSDKV